MLSFASQLRVSAALAASVSLLGMAPQAGSTLYLRVPNLKAAPAVTGLTYDAVATVPARPNTPAALLPQDQVEGSMLLTYATTTLRVDASNFRGVTSFIVVQVDTKGSVIERTAFDGVTIESVDLVGTQDGSMTRKISFRAQKVVVTEPTYN